MKDTYLVKVDAATGRVRANKCLFHQTLWQISKGVKGYAARLPLKYPATVKFQYVDCYVDEDGALVKNPIINRVISDLYGDTIFGNAVFARHTRDGDLVGLTKAQRDHVVKWLCCHGGNRTAPLYKKRKPK